jgi:hypothetical protein
MDGRPDPATQPLEERVDGPATSAQPSNAMPYIRAPKNEEIWKTGSKAGPLKPLTDDAKANSVAKVLSSKNTTWWSSQHGDDMDDKLVRQAVLKCYDAIFSKHEGSFSLAKVLLSSFFAFNVPIKVRAHQQHKNCTNHPPPNPHQLHVTITSPSLPPSLPPSIPHYLPPSLTHSLTQSLNHSPHNSHHHHVPTGTFFTSRFQGGGR